MAKLSLTGSLTRSPHQRYTVALDNMGNLSWYYQPKQMRPPTILTREWAPGLASNATARFLFPLIAQAWQQGFGYDSTGYDSLTRHDVMHADWLSRAATTMMLLKPGYHRFVTGFVWFMRYNLAAYFAQNTPAALTPPGTHDATLLPPQPLCYFGSPPDAVVTPPVLASVTNNPPPAGPDVTTDPPTGFGLAIGPALGPPVTVVTRAHIRSTIAGQVRYTGGTAQIIHPSPLAPGLDNYCRAVVQPISLPPSVDPSDPTTWGGPVMPILTPGPRQFFTLLLTPP